MIQTLIGLMDQALLHQDLVTREDQRIMYLPRPYNRMLFTLDVLMMSTYFQSISIKIH
jgi:hypothetical protein